MIIGQLEDWGRCFAGDVWKRAFQHVMSLTANAAEGVLELEGSDMMARVMSYQTVGREAAKLEAHRSFVDIQAPLENEERIDWFPLRGLVAKDAYDGAKDVIHFECPTTAPASVTLVPGMYAVMFPEDAHMPKLFTVRPIRIRKVVVKVHLSLLGQV